MKSIVLGALIMSVIAPAWSIPASRKTYRPPARAFELSRVPFQLNILPRSFQKNPSVDLNVITEMTRRGARLKRPTQESPTYYILEEGLYQNLGEAAPAGMKPPPTELLRKAMVAALAQKGYLEAEPPVRPPTMALVFAYGGHSATNGEVEMQEQEMIARQLYEQAALERALNQTDIAEAPPLIAPGPAYISGSADTLLPFVLADRRKQVEVIERASLIGGAAFAEDLAGVLKDEVSARRAAVSSERSALLFAEQREEENTYDPSEWMRRSVNGGSPFQFYYRRDAMTTYLVDEAFGSCYYVIASAYDGAALAKGERRLLWRTKMTVNSHGVSMADTMPVLIAAAVPYFGEKMTEVATVTRRVVRRGKVDVGEATVVEDAADGEKASSSDETK